MKKKIPEIRNEYSKSSLSKADVNKDPYVQFQNWLNDAIHAKLPEPSAMALSTTGKNMQPSSRMVLLKDIKDNGLLFYTNYESKKGMQIKENPYASLLFFWPELERQIRIEGRIEKTSEKISDEYYLSRPGKSRIGAWASPQSKEIESRKWLEEKHADYELEFIGNVPERPKHWGGYMLIPYQFEFWQGRPKRLHDRIEYYRDNDEWRIRRLAP